VKCNIALIILLFVLYAALMLSGCKKKNTEADDNLYGGDGKAAVINNGTENKSSDLIEESVFIFDALQTTSKVKVTPPTAEDVKAAREAGTFTAVIKTSRGDIEVELYGDKAPLSVANFIKLAEAGFYDGLTFHRVEPEFVIQGGDPTGDGSGGPGYSIKREINPELKHVVGALAWARSNDPNSAGSQFYITLSETAFLDNAYAVFGKVTKGMEAVKKVKQGDIIKGIVTNKPADGEKNAEAKKEEGSEKK